MTTPVPSITRTGPEKQKRKMASDGGVDGDESDNCDELLRPSRPGDKDWIIRDQDRFLPIANVARIMKRMVPPPGKIAKEAKECVQAAERAGNEKRETITGEDILYALQELGFENYVEPLNIYLDRYRAALRVSAKESGSSSSTAPPPMLMRQPLAAGSDVDDDQDESAQMDVASVTPPPTTSRRPARPVRNPVVNTTPLGHDLQMVTLSDGTQLHVNGQTAQFLLTNQNACAAISESGNRQQVMSQKQMMSAALQSNTIYVDPNTGQNYVPVSSANGSGVIQLVPVDVNDKSPAKKRR